MRSTSLLLGARWLSPSLLGVLFAVWLCAAPTAWATEDAPEKPLPPVPAAAAQMPVPATSASTEATDERVQSIARLTDLQRRLELRRAELQELRRKVRDLPKEAIEPDVARRLEELPQTIANLESSFEQIAVNGLDFAALTREEPASYEWQTEILEIVRPVLGSLKELTEKPRRIEALRRDIARAEQQSEAIGRALESIVRLRDVPGPKVVDDGLAALNETWLQRLGETENNLQVLRYQLATLQGEPLTDWEGYVLPVREFLLGRGTTVLIALVVGLVVFASMRLALRLILLFTARHASQPRRRGRERAFRYLFRIVTVLLIVASSIVVFYARSDMLLLALTAIAVVMILATLRQTVPKYLRELQLLLDLGEARSGERVVYQGIPMRVGNIATLASLNNPELEGTLRISLESLGQLSSRPVVDEPWFPCRVGEYVLFPDNTYAEVVRQTVEIVRLRMMGSIVDIRTADFYGRNVRNLSREGFVVPVTFGVDYSYQKICLTEMAPKMHARVSEAIAAQEWGEHCEDVFCQFNTASADSLDFIIVARMRGEAAANYWAVGRCIRQALVGLSNDEGWVIPFRQITVQIANDAGSAISSLPSTTVAPEPAVIR